MVAKFDLAFTRCWNKLKTVRNLTVKMSLEDLDAKEMYLTYTLRIDQSCSESVKKMFCFIIFECSHGTVSKLCRIEFRFQIYGFQNLPALKGVQIPAAFAIVCFCSCEFRTANYSESCAEQVVEFAQSMLVFVLPLKVPFSCARELYPSHFSLFSKVPALCERSLT